MLTLLSVLAVSFIAGLGLFSFIKPVTKSSYEEIIRASSEATEKREQTK